MVNVIPGRNLPALNFAYHLTYSVNRPVYIVNSKQPLLPEIFRRNDQPEFQESVGKWKAPRETRLPLTVVLTTNNKSNKSNPILNWRKRMQEAAFWTISELTMSSL